MSKTREGNSPQDVFTGLGAPRVRKVLSGCNAGRDRPAKGRPTLGWAASGGQRRETPTRGPDDPAYGDGLRLTSRTPGALVEHHPARRAWIGNDFEPQARAFTVKSVPPAGVAIARRLPWR